MTTRATTLRRCAAALAVCAVALLLRFAHADRIYAGGTVRLGPDTDPHYHVLQAERILRGVPGAPWFDPNLDWPNGATVPWPPLFDGVLAAVSGVAHGADATRDQIAGVAAAIPPVLGAVSALVVAALAAVLLGRGAWLAALLLALMPAHGEWTSVGRADQHALELVVTPALWLAFLLAWRGRGPKARWAATAALALLVAVAFWSWMGSAFILAFPAMAVALLHLAGAPEASRAARSLAIGVFAGALLLAASLLILGPPGAILRTEAIGLTGLHVAIAAGCAASAALLALAARIRIRPAGPARRALELAASLAIPLLATLGASAGLREGAVRGLVPLRAAGAWYSDIAEFLPLVGAGVQPAIVEVVRVFQLFGFGLVALLAALPWLVRRAAGDAEARAAALVTAGWTLAAVAVAFARMRFTPYAALLVAPLAAVGLLEGARALERRSGRRWVGRVASAALVVLVFAPTLGRWLVAPPFPGGELVAALEWLGSQPERGDGREGVATLWDYGHAVQYYARRPVLASPFGTEAGASSLAYLAWFAFATDEEQASEVLRRRRVGYVMVGDPMDFALDVRGFAPPGAPDVARIEIDAVEGTSIGLRPGLLTLVLSRLAVLDGAATPAGRPPLSRFRLLFESPVGVHPFKVFGAVEGARLAVTNAMPGAIVSARVDVTTGTGRTFALTLEAAADAAGRATLRVPYATGANGTSTAGRAVVTDGAGLTTVPIPERAVLDGLEARVALQAGHRP